MSLYEAILAPLEVAAVREVVMDLIRSPREFPPPVGVIYTEAKAEQTRLGRIDSYRDRRREPGFIAYTPSGQRMLANENGVMEPALSPAIPAITQTQRHWVGKMLENFSLPRAIAKRLAWDRGERPDKLQRLGTVIPIRENLES